MNTLGPQKRLTRSPEATRALAAEWLAQWREIDPLILALKGEIGSGKTCFVQGLALAMGISVPITSPTYTIVNEYRGRMRKLIHADWYRLKDAAEVATLGLEEALNGSAVMAVEWPERADWWLPPATIILRFEHGRSADQRIVTMLSNPARSAPRSGRTSPVLSPVLQS